jgi:putative ABC transport system substrate-binding protein
MKRRQFIAGIGSAAAWPLAARTQQGQRVRRVAVLHGGASDPSFHARVAALRDQLQQLGWNEGGNIRIELHSAEGDPVRGRTLAAELVAVNPDVLVMDTTSQVREVQRLTRTIPIVFAGVGDPVASGIVASLAHPGGNATGFMFSDFTIGGRWLQLLKEIAPSLSRVLMVGQAGNVGDQALLRVIEEAALSLGVQVSSAAIQS